MVDIRDYVRPIWSRLWLVVGIVAIATTATYAHYNSKPQRFETSTALYLQRGASSDFLGTIGSTDERFTANQAALLKTREVAKLAAKRLDYKGDPSALLALVGAEAAEGSDFVTVGATGSNPQDAAAVANAFAQAFVEKERTRVANEARAARLNAERELESLGGRGTGPQQEELVLRIRRLEAIESVPNASVRQLDPALVPGAPTYPDPGRNALFAFVVSLMLAIGVAFLLERLDRRLKRVEDIQPHYGHPLLGELPRAPQPSPNEAGEVALPDGLREPIRALRTNVQLASLDRPVRTLLVTSAVSQEGKSTVVRNLALAYREAGLKVVVIESDFRRPSMAKMFSADQGPGLTEVLTGHERLENALQTVPVHLPGIQTLAKLKVIPGLGAANGSESVDDPGRLALLVGGAQPPNPSAVLAAERMREVLSEIAEDNDIVLVDTAPINAVSDAVPLLSIVDGVILVARLGLTTTTSTRRVSSLIERIPDVNVLGVVANDVSYGALDGHSSGRSGYYSYE